MIEHQDHVTLASPGQRLLAARQAAGLSQAEIAARTRIPLASIQAIESDDWMQLPAPVYLRGFLRLYANELGMDADAIVGAWRALAGDAGGRDRPRSAQRSDGSRQRTGKILGAIAGLAAMAVVVGIVFALMTDEVGGVGEADAGGEAAETSTPGILD